MGSGVLRILHSCSWNVIECVKILASCNDVNISGKSCGVLYCEETNKIVIWGTYNVCFEVSLMYNSCIIKSFANSVDKTFFTRYKITFHFISFEYHPNL